VTKKREIEDAMEEKSISLFIAATKAATTPEKTKAATTPEKWQATGKLL
jgi:hypothetical protein